MSQYTTGSMPASIPIPHIDTSTSIMPLSDPIDHQISSADNVYDRLIAQNAEQYVRSPKSPLGVSHPTIFRKGTLIEIPDIDPQGVVAGQSRRRASNTTRTPLPERFVAIAIKDCDQTESIIHWSIRKILIPDRDKVVLIHVRPAVNGLIGDLTAVNSSKEAVEREKSHDLLRRYASLIKAEGYRIKGVSIRGVDIRGELVRKLVELKCDVLVIGSHASKSMKERFIGSKVNYLVENSPCPVIVIGRNNRVSQQAPPGH
ncbi:hypothetical protein FBU59_003328 [Linderina macrospora]|uniref:Uncharacterized protein n=1 Tax=Linderina macrospora TaxID=4868 RepID=A0ACC1J8U8_9FUNG|nr:hypothetical protein FBU59_003328 [Linderina macrospora]